MDGVEGIGYGEIAEITLPGGEVRPGQVLETTTTRAMVQVFRGTRNLDTELTQVRFRGEPMKSPCPLICLAGPLMAVQGR